MPQRSRVVRAPSDVRDIFERRQFVAHIDDLVAAGVSQSRVSRLVQKGVLRKIGRGCYTDAYHYDRIRPWQRFALQSRALAMSTGSDVALSGWSAATVAWQMPTIGPVPRRPQGIRSADSRYGANTSPIGQIRTAQVPLERFVCSRVVDGTTVRATDPAWTVVDLARVLPVHHGLVLADNALRRGVDMAAALPAIHGWLGVGRARWVVNEARAGCETPIETLGRVPLYVANLPMPVFNAWVGVDRPRYRVDALWPWHHVAAEADGSIKYDNRPDAHGIVRAQYEREWELEKLGLYVLRYDWELATTRIRELTSRYTTVLAAHPPQTQPIRWWKDDHGTPVDVTWDDQPDPGPSGIALPAGWNKPLRRL